jgi:hypothetical protein
MKMKNLIENEKYSYNNNYDQLEEEIFITLTRFQRLLGSQLKYLHKDDRKFYLEEEQKYRNLVSKVLKIASMKKGQD